MKLGLWILAAAAVAVGGCAPDWRSASRESAGVAPDPASVSDAVVQVYAARVWGWRGVFADHTWVAAKAAGADYYTVYEVIGWGLRRRGTALRIARDTPDRKWFGAQPRILADLRGAQAEAVAAKVDDAARRYPYPKEYRAFPGPNSNTFTAWIAEEVPELNLRLPLRAVGKNYPLRRPN